MSHIIGGLICVLLGVWGIIVWWYEFGAVMRGTIPFLLLGFGVIAIIAGLQTQQENEQEETEESEGLAGETAE